MDEIEVNLPQKNRFYQRRPPEIIAVLEKASFKEKFERTLKKAIDRSSVFKSFFGAQGCSKE